MAPIGSLLVAFGSTKLAPQATRLAFTRLRSAPPPAPARRCLSSKPGKDPGKSTSNSTWHVATVAAFGVSFVGVRYTLQYMSREDEATTDLDGSERAKPQAEITSKVFFDVAIDNNAVGRIQLGLYGGVVPKTVKNFETLCEGTKKKGNLRLSFESSTFHRIIPNFMIQGGDFTNHDGTGGISTFDVGIKFQDENFQLKHVGPYVLSMANAGPNTNGSQFFITTKNGPLPHLDGRHVVFGTVTDGFDVIKLIEMCGSSSGRPNRRVVITKAGVLEEGKPADHQKEPDNNNPVNEKA